MDIRRLVWEGSIPLEISLNDPEGILCETSTLPFYVNSLLNTFFIAIVIVVVFMIDDGEKIVILSITSDGD